MKKVLVLVAVLLLAGGAYAVPYLRDLGAIAAGYVSHTLCTNVFLVGRELR